MASITTTSSGLVLDPDAFLIPMSEERALLYAPRKGVALVVDGVTSAWLSKLGEDPASALDPVFEQVQIPLRAMGLLRSPSSDRPTISGPDEIAFAPTAVTLFVTTACNLRCIYCYSCGGDRPRTMPTALAEEATRFVVHNAHRLGTGATIHFHGGGEPTLVLPLLVSVVKAAKREARDLRVPLRFTLGTNGVMSEEAARWVATNIHQVTLSLDGHADLHDAQRRLLSGASSHAAVLRTLRTFEEWGLPISLRTTLMAGREAELLAIVKHLVTVSSAKSIKVEPVFIHGRAKAMGLREPDADRFIEAFLEARAVAKSAGRELLYSGSRPDVLTDRFCSAPSHSMCVTPEGELTACYEVADRDDSRADMFFFGRHLGPGLGFEVDPGALARLSSLSVDNAKSCAHCFAKWHCAGDCPAKTLSAADTERELVRTYRCQINRELLRRELIERVEAGEDLLPRDDPQ